jgi:chromosome segregation protein
LLKLKKIELIGFKSFCEKTVIKFSGAGVTCIVGPNGCGKSNIVDAMSWVLGEQSHKSLRAERMSDCIFNGTQKRPPLGMAEVFVTLEDPELAEAAQFVMQETEDEVRDAKEGEEVKEAEQAGQSEQAEAQSAAQPIVKQRRAARPMPHMKPGEVVVGRRLYRSGQSEYIVNGRVARLRDVQELFMGTGLGPESYAIIEQGRIGQVLSSRPTDRRAIIEEAAGVSRYKTKRRLAEAKLESSKLNLARVNDILVEIEKQLASLKRQAARARRFAELREQMRAITRQVLGSKALELDREARRLEEQIHAASLAEQQESDSMRALEAEQERLTARNYELEQHIRQGQNLLGQTSLELDRAENRIAFNRERLASLGSRAASLAAEAQQAHADASELEAARRRHRLAAAGLREAFARAAAALEERSARAAAMASEAEGCEQRIAELRSEAARLAEEMTRLDREHAQAEAALAYHAENRARVEHAEQESRSQWEGQSAHAREADAAWQLAEQEARRLEQSVKNWHVRILGLKHEQQSLAQRYDRLREELAGIRARKSTAEQILAERSYTAEAVQKLFAANGQGEERGFRAVGVLADYAEVEESYEAAVEQFLRDELQYVVVETFDHARAGIAMLRDEMGGRATFFVDSIQKLNLSAPSPEMPFRAGEGVLAPLGGVVQFRDPLGPAAVNFLPRLRSAFVVESAGAAEQLAQSYPQYQFVTVDGTCYSGRTVSGGRPNEAGPLALKRELRLLEIRAADAESQVAEAAATRERIAEELRQCEMALGEAIARHMEAEKALVTAGHARQLCATELARLERQLADCGSEIVRLRAEHEAAAGRAAEARRRRERAQALRLKAESEARESELRAAALRAELAAGQEDMASRRAELAVADERLSGAVETERRLDAEWQDASARAESLASQQRDLEREQADLSAATSALERQRAELAAEKERLGRQRELLEQEWHEARVRAVATEDTLRTARQRLGDLREERSQREIERARNDSDRRHLSEMCATELNAQPEILIAEIESGLTPALAGQELSAAESNFRELRTKLENLGAVNMMALEEYQECEQRHAFLVRERDDLVQSIADTQQTIKELDEISRQKFEEAFAVINRNFAACFATLFGGGTGEMRLTEPDSSGDRGIEIVAQPPGKRLQNVLLLSGGEKALTALALLIGIFRYQPSPFCILDEVDAPLDEANVGRFTRLVNEMCSQTQFLIVTHNKRTMEMAPVLYGVTMQEPGVSKLVSVRWDEPAAAPASAA